MIDAPLAGYIYAFVASLFFALYVVPKKLTKQAPALYSLFMSFGFLVGSAVLYCISLLFFDIHETFTYTHIFYSALIGICWAFGSIFLLSSIDSIGLARSNQWKNLQGPIGIILSIIILSEFLYINVLFTIFAGLSIFISALLFTIKQERETQVKPQGIMLALMAAVMGGIVTVLNKFITTNSFVYTQLIVWSFFTFLSLIFYILKNKQIRKQVLLSKRKDILPGCIGGILYSIAGFLTLQSYVHIPASISFTIIQLNALWIVLIGILYFREIDYKRHSWRILIGIFFTCIGVLFLFYAKK